MTAATGKRLGKTLVQAGLITQDQMEEALAEAGERSLATALVDKGFADDVAIARAVADQLGLTYVDLGLYDIDPNCATLLSSDLARRYKVIPISLKIGTGIGAIVGWPGTRSWGFPASR